MTEISGVHLTRWGDTGTKLVLIHGGVQGTKQSGAAHFSAQERLAERGYELLVPDRPGHGRSPAPNRPDDAEADGEWVAELLGDGAHLVGHSFGGCVALAATSRRPAAVKSLTLIEPGMQALAIDKLPVPALCAADAGNVEVVIFSRTTDQAILEAHAHPGHDGWSCR